MDSSELNHNWNNVCEQVKTYDNVDASQVNAFFCKISLKLCSNFIAGGTAHNVLTTT